MSIFTWYRIEPPEVDNQFWPVEVDEISDKLGHRHVTVKLGGAEQVAQRKLSYDDTERMNGRWEIAVQDGLHERGDLRDNEGIMLFKLPPNKRGVEYVAYSTRYIEVKNQ